jgi:transposase-like protein
MPRYQRDYELEQTWRQHIHQQAASGDTIRDYCRDHDLNETAFYFWRRTLAERDRPASAKARTAAPAFVPVTVIDPPRTATDSPIDIRLTNGHRLRIRSGCDRELLAAVLVLLEGQPC